MIVIMLKKHTAGFLVFILLFGVIAPFSGIMSETASAADALIFEDTFTGRTSGVPSMLQRYFRGAGSITNTVGVSEVTYENERLKVFVAKDATAVFSRNFPASAQPITSGKVMIEFDFEMTQIGNYNLAFPGLQGSASETNYMQIMMANNDAKLTPVNYTISANTKYKQKIIADYTPAADGNYYYDYYLENLDTGEVVLTDKKRAASDGFKALATKNFDKLYFNIQSNNGPQTIYLDNIRVTKVDSLAVSELALSDDTVIADNDANIPFDSSLKLKLNSALTDDILPYISITPALNMQKSVNTVNNNVVDLTFPDGMGYGVKYKVSVDKAASDARGISMDNDFATSFTTEAGNFLFLEGFSFADGTPVADGQTDIPLTSSFKLTFSTDIDPATLPGITMTPNVANKQITLDSVNNKIINITFPIGLEYGKSYTITLPVTLANTSGQGLYMPIVKTFKTESEVYVPDVNENTIFFDTFDDWADGYVPNLSANKYDVWAANANRSVSVDNKRLKIHTNNADMSFTRMTDMVINSGKVAVEFEFEFNIVGNNCLAFPAIQSSDAPGEPVSFVQPQVVPNITQVGDNIPLTANTKYKQVIISNYTPIDGNYFYDYYLYNLSTPEAPPIVERKDMPAPARFKTESVNKDFTKVMFRVGSNSNIPPMTLYIDNLTAYRIPDLEVSSFSYPGGAVIADNQTGISVQSQFRAAFNSEVSEGTTGGITISPSVPMETTIDPGNKKFMNITFPKGLVYDTEYTITFPSTMKNIAGNPLSGGYSKTFTTEAEPADLIVIESTRFTDFSDNTITSFPSDGKICAEVTVKSNAISESVEKDFYLIIAVKDSGGQLIDIAFMNTTIGYNETQTLSAGFTLTGNTGTMSCDLYMWDGLPGSAYGIKKVLP